MIKFVKKNGFTILELLLVISIMSILSAIVLTTYVDFRRHESLSKDTETVVQVLNQARNQTISSRNQSVYGVHIASSTITIFTGGTYDQNSPTNQVINLNPIDTIVNLSLNGGGVDVVFRRITGETGNYGTVTIASTGLTNTRTVTIYETGVVEF